MIEEWRRLSDSVEVSSYGRVKKDGRIIKPSTRGGHGYLRVSVGLKERYVHRLVLKAFKDKPLGKNYANHRNHNKLDNRISNLEWSTSRENTLLAAKEGRFSNRYSRSTPVKVTWPDGTFVIFPSQAEASAAIGADKRGTSINKALHGDRKTTHGVKVEYYDGRIPGPYQMDLSEFGI